MGDRLGIHGVVDTNFRCFHSPWDTKWNKNVPAQIFKYMRIQKTPFEKLLMMTSSIFWHKCWGLNRTTKQRHIKTRALHSLSQKLIWCIFIAWTILKYFFKHTNKSVWFFINCTEETQNLQNISKWCFLEHLMQAASAVDSGTAVQEKVDTIPAVRSVPT